MSSTEVKQIELDPFGYWPHYESALAGFGGAERPHEPRYCFCTIYVVPEPGPCRFVVNMTGVRATRGEIALRVHALRLTEPPEIGLAASSYVSLEGIEGDEIEHDIRFTALEGLRYAFFGYFNAPSDLQATAVYARLEELGGPVAVHANLGIEPVSRFARKDYVTSHRLIAPGTGAPRGSLSQAYSAEQVNHAAMQAEWPDVVAAEPDPRRQWEIVTALRALDLGGVDVGGARGLVIDAVPKALEQELVRRGIGLDRAEQSPPSGEMDEPQVEDYGAQREGIYDFIVSYALARAEPTLEGRLQIIGAGLRCLRGRGVGLFVMPFWTGNVHEPRPLAAADCFDRNAVQQIALRLIGQSYSVSQLAFPPPPRRGGGEITSYILIAHKLA